TATFEDIDRLCREAVEYGFYSVCVNSTFVEYAVKQLVNTPVVVCTTVGFPLGAVHKETKAYEARKAVSQGALEVDMVINLGLLKSGDYFEVREDIEGVVKAVKQENKDAKVKVIIETCFLSESEKVTAAKLCQEANADFVKTSTGFGTGGATVEDVKLLRMLVGNTMGVKASGGIRDLDTMLKMIEAGANRIGTSSGVAIIEELIKKSQ
ncbi:deoxyribose-phosphate aldolase, partial [Thermovenabulum sp.]